MGKYALTEQERKWLEKRKKRCERCTHYSPNIVWCQCMHNFKTDAYSLEPNYRDAAEFEARVSRYIAENASELDFSSNNWQFFDGFKAKSLAWYILREARIAVEEKMDQ